MNTFKTQFLALEASVKELREKLQKLEGTIPSVPDCHYVSFQKEAGELPLDCMDTFRFIYTLHPKGLGGFGIHAMYSYKCINPSEDIKIYYKNDYQRKYGLDIVTEIPPESFEQSGIKMGSIRTFDNGVPKVPITKEIKDELQNKFFMFSKDTETEFFNTETVQFKQEYEILPHVSFFITPLEKSNLTCKIIEITKKSVTFEIRYVNPVLDSSPDAVLHWQIHGVKKPSEQADLLL